MGCITMKVFKNILFILSMAAISSNGLMAMKRKAEGELDKATKRQKIQGEALPNTEFLRHEGDLFSEALVEYKEKMEMNNLIASMAGINPHIQADIDESVANILFGDGDHEKFQAKLDALCFSGKVTDAKATMKGLFASMCTFSRQMPTNNLKDYKNTQTLLEKLEGASTVQMALLLAFAKVKGLNICPSLDANFLVENIDYMVLLFRQEKSRVFFSELYLRDTLRLLEAVKGSEVDFLDLAGLGLSSLPPDIRLLDELNVLILTKNGLRTIPKEIGELKKLETLYLKDNQLSSLPCELCDIKTLTFLDLSNNHLSNLPPNLVKLELMWLSLENNVFDEAYKNTLRDVFAHIKN